MIWESREWELARRTLVGSQSVTLDSEVHQGVVSDSKRISEHMTRVPETLPRSKFRLDSAHHHSQSRWLQRPDSCRSEAKRISPQFPDRLDGQPICSSIVANRQSNNLAAMVNWIVNRSANPPFPSVDRIDGDSFASISGPAVTESAGLVRFCSPAGGGHSRYLLVESETDSRFSLPDQTVGSKKVERYSLNPGHDWWAGDLRGVDGYYRFRAYHHGEFCTQVCLQIPGVHQVLPALAAVAIGVELGISRGVIKERLEEFSGIPRGFESRGSFRGATLVDDEAIGPGGIGSALRIAREVFGQRPLRAIYLPDVEDAKSHRPETTEFVEADQLIVVEPESGWQEWTRHFVASLRSSRISVIGCSTINQAIREMDRCLQPGDVLVTLGASEVGTIADAFLRRLFRDRHG